MKPIHFAAHTKALRPSGRVDALSVKTSGTLVRALCALGIFVSLGGVASSAFAVTYDPSGAVVTQTISAAGFYNITAAGAAGGPGPGGAGKGATASGTFFLPTGTTLQIAVAGVGANGFGAGGGGGSFVYIDTSTPLVVAGGGGGGGALPSATGGDGQAASSGGDGGGGAGFGGSNGGGGGSGSTSNGGGGGAGLLGAGGGAASFPTAAGGGGQTAPTFTGGFGGAIGGAGGFGGGGGGGQGGGGGGGYSGGGGGVNTAAGGGGGSFVAPTYAGAAVISPTITAGANTGNGSVTVTLANPPLKASLIVTTTADTFNLSGPQTSLREALAYASSLSGPQTIKFSTSTDNGATNFADGAHTIALAANGDPAFSNAGTFGPSALVVNTDVTIDAATSKVTISRDTNAQPDRLRLFYVTPTGTLTLKNLTLSDGLAHGGDVTGAGGGAGLGGAIVNAGTLNLLRVTMSGNHALGGASQNSGSGAGGGLGGNGPNESSGSGGAGGFGGGGTGGCPAGAGGFGGGGGSSTCNNSKGQPAFGGAGGFGGGGGGGVAGSNGGFGGGGGNSGGDVSLGGGGGGMGGAIFNYAGTLSVVESTLASNVATGGGDVGGSGFGGAIFNLNGAVTATNATIAGNVAAEGGGAIYSLGDNGIATQSGPILPATAAVVTLNNTILSGSTDGSNNAVIDYIQNTNNSNEIGGASAIGTASSAGHNNIIQIGGSEFTNGANGNKVGNSGSPIDPLLGALADNGGPTQTMALVRSTPLSPAIDTGDNSLAVDANNTALSTDQRGAGHARIINNTVDVGAYEAKAKADQTITFAQIPTKTYGDPAFNLSATASSGLPVSFSFTGPITLNGSTVTITGAGPVGVLAKQAGDDSYNAATPVVRSFNVVQATPSVGVTSNENPANVGDSVTFTATVSGPAGAGTPSGSVQFNDNGNPLGAAQTLGNAGTAGLTTSSLAAGPHTITAAYSGDGNYTTATGTLNGGEVINGPTPTPTPTATPAPTATPVPTGTPIPTATPSATSIPTATPAPTSTPIPTGTPLPTATPTATSIPTATPAPTSTPTGTTTPTATPAPALASEPLNISTRMEVLSSDNVLIAGFIVTGEPGATKKVMIRGLGLSLAQAGVANPLADPLLELHEPDGTVVVNDNWADADNASEIPDGFQPTDQHESVIIATLTIGPDGFANYTAIVRGANGETGVGLVEAYDLEAGTNQFANISTRGFIDTGANVMIGGFILGGSDQGSKVLIRAIAPSLPVSGALADPTLELHDSQGTKIRSNDNWKVDDATGQSQEAAIEATTIPPSNDLESAILDSFPPGAYTAIVAGKNGGTGVGLVEVYNLP